MTSCSLLFTDEFFLFYYIFFLKTNHVLEHHHSNICPEAQDILCLCCVQVVLGDLDVCLDSVCPIWCPFSVACVSCNITVILCVNVIFMQRIWFIMSKSIPWLNSFEFKNMFNVATQSFWSGLFNYLRNPLFCPSYREK